MRRGGRPRFAGLLWRRGAAAFRVGMLVSVLGLVTVVTSGCDTVTDSDSPGSGAGPDTKGTTAVLPAGEATTSSTIPVTLLEVIDGDTIRVLMPDEREEKVRYIGIDAPEAARSDASGEYLGDEASRHNARLLASGPLTLQTDVEERDPFGRLLAYAWAGDVLVNERLVLEGYARAHSYPPNLGLQPRLQKAEQEARRQGVGLWASTSTT